MRIVNSYFSHKFSDAVNSIRITENAHRCFFSVCNSSRATQRKLKRSCCLYLDRLMTAINIATDIPSGINTLEKLAVWACATLANINPGLVAIEGVGYSERCAQAGNFYVTADNKYRFLGRVSVQMSSDHLAGGAKMWTYALELSSAAVPLIFKSN